MYPLTAFRFNKSGHFQHIAKAATKNEIEKLAEKFEPALAKAIMSAIETQTGDVSLDAIAAALEQGDAVAVLRMLKIEVLDAAMAEAASITQQIVVEAGAMTAAQYVIPRLTGFEFRFNTLAPALIDWLRTYDLGLIREIDKNTREAVRDALITGMQEGHGPRATARDVRDALGLTKRQAKAVKNFRKELATFHQKRSAKGWNLGAKISRAPGGAQTFAINPDGSPKDAILERRLRDFRFDGALQRSMTQGKPLTPDQIDRMTAGYLRKMLKWRAENIARTESLKAANFGAQEAWRQAIAAGKVSEALVRRQWIVAKDERLCPTCKPIPGMNPAKGVKFAEPFATPIGPVAIPPVHPSCRCTIFIRFYEPEQFADVPAFNT